MLDSLKVKIDVEIGPVEVTGREFLDIEHRFGRRFAEPWEVIVIKEKLSVPVSQPNPMRGQLYDLSFRSNAPMHLRFPPSGSE
jgi:hypothetical protein